MDTIWTFDGGGLNLDGDNDFDLAFDYNGIDLGGGTDRWESDWCGLQLWLVQLWLIEAESNQDLAKKLLQNPNLNIGKFSSVSAAVYPQCGRILHCEENAENKWEHKKEILASDEREKLGQSDILLGHLANWPHDSNL